MWTAISCCICFVLGLACDDKPQVTYNISEQRNTQLAVPYGSGVVSWIQMMSNKWIKRGNSQKKPYQTLFIYLNYSLQTELNVDPIVNFFFFCDNQFTYVGFQSTIVLCTQEHRNTPCRGLKKTEKKSKKIPNTINAFTSTLPILNRQ